MSNSTTTPIRNAGASSGRSIDYVVHRHCLSVRMTRRRNAALDTMFINYAGDLSFAQRGTAIGELSRTAGSLAGG